MNNIITFKNKDIYIYYFIILLVEIIEQYKNNINKIFIRLRNINIFKIEKIIKRIFYIIVYIKNISISYIKNINILSIKKLYYIYFIIVKSDIDSSREESDLFIEDVKIKIRGYDKKEDIWKGMVNMNKDVNVLYNNYIQSINVKIENIEFNGLELYFFPDPFRPNFFHILYYNKNKKLEGVSYKGKIIPQNDMYISSIWFKVKLIINGNNCHTYLSVQILDKSGGSTPKIKYSNISRPGNNSTGKINLNKGNVSILLPKDIDFERLNQGFTVNYNTMYRTFSFQNIEGYKCYIDKDYGLFNLFKGYKNVEISNIGENCCIYYYNGNEYHKVSSSKTDIKKDESNTTGNIIGIGILLIIISVLY